MGLFSWLFGRTANTGPNTPKAGPTSEYEASMNFDIETVRPFLQRLHDRREMDFDVEALARFTQETDAEAERETIITIVYAGRQIPLRFGVFMDDIDSPDLYFFSSDLALIEAINGEYEAFAEELGI